MKIIIAPSKTMKYRDCDFTPEKQLFPDETKYLHSLLKQYNDEDLCHLMKISYKQAQKVYHYYHQTQIEHPALAFYQGTVFKQLQLNQYAQHLSYLDQHLRIMSAYYGILKYNTAMTPYRLDMTMKLDKVNLYEYWYTPVFRYFEDEDFIISLASMEFTNMVHHPHLYFIDFMEIHNDKIKRNAMTIKKARGQMLHQMIIHEIQTIEDLKTLSIDGFIYRADYSQENTFAFVKEIND